MLYRQSSLVNELVRGKGGSVGAANQASNSNPMSYLNLSDDDLIKGQFEQLLRENEEFLVQFDLCKEDLLNQIKSILFQHERLSKLYK